jgi:hypothetical protein
MPYKYFIVRHHFLMPVASGSLAVNCFAISGGHPDGIWTGAFLWQLLLSCPHWRSSGAKHHTFWRILLHLWMVGYGTVMDNNEQEIKIKYLNL